MWPISAKVNYPRNDTPDILDRVDFFPTDRPALDGMNSRGQNSGWFLFLAAKLEEAPVGPAQALTGPLLGGYQADDAPPPRANHSLA